MSNRCETSRRLPERIYLVGFMGCGKTTVGRRLARDLRWLFLDLDREIEIETGMSVREIFRSEGEEHFRRLERSELERTATLSNVVVATGGGLWMRPENRELIAESGLSLWLDLPLDELLTRLDRSAGSRPLHKNRESTTQLFEERLPAYREAALRVPVSDAEAPAQVSRRIVSLLYRGWQKAVRSEARVDRCAT